MLNAKKRGWMKTWVKGSFKRKETLKKKKDRIRVLLNMLLHAYYSQTWSYYRLTPRVLSAEIPLSTEPVLANLISLSNQP